MTTKTRAIELADELEEISRAYEMVGYDDVQLCRAAQELRRLSALEQQGEAVAYRHMMDDGWEYFDAPTGDACPECQPLYTAPQHPAADLTEDQVSSSKWATLPKVKGVE